MTTSITSQELQICRISFPEIRLEARDAHKLRGYFGNLFREHSPLLHNHYDDGKFRYKYPEIQYKVISGIPVLIGLNHGAQLLPQLFLKIRELDIDGRQYLVNHKDVSLQNEISGYSNNLHEYKFETLWMALNQSNYAKYRQLKSSAEKNKMLNAILVGQILSFFTNVGIGLKKSERLMVKVHVEEKSAEFKNNRMLVFSGSFIGNVILPNGIGLGRSVSRGFGAIRLK